MKKYCLTLFCAMTLISGCEEGSAPQAQAPKSTVSLVSAGQQAIELPGGTKIGFDGKIVKSYIDENKNGKYQRHVIELPAEVMSVEGTFFSNLAKVGYQRKNNSEANGFQIYSYTKKGTPSIRASFKNLDKAEAKAAPQTRLVISWKV